MPIAAKQSDLIIVAPENIKLAGHWVLPSGHGPPVFEPSPFNAPLTLDLSENVFIDGWPAATVKSNGINIPPHSPPPGTTFDNPSMVTNIGMVVTGSAKVKVNGNPLARHGDICLICQDSGPEPLGMVLVVTGTVNAR